MNKTKHDLSAGIAKLSLNSLIELANIASGQAKVNCERELSALQHTLLYGKDKAQAKYDARNLATAANSAAIAFENLHYLIEAKERNEVIVVD
jgi:hypothetical protein